MLLIKNIHRHTGGLEITGKFIKKSVYIHRHTGGLENIKQGEKQLFSLRYDTVGYCSLAVTDSSNLELYGTTHKRISRKLAKVLHNYANYEADDDYISCYTDNYISFYTDRYITSHNYSQSLMFKL